MLRGVQPSTHHRRRLCVAAVDAAYRLLELDQNATRAHLKKRFYDLAKLTHPDVAPPTAALGAADAESDADASADAYAAPSDTTAPRFIDVLAAYELLDATLQQRHDDGAGVHGATSPANAAPSSSPLRRNRRSASARRLREKSLGELLCDRLDDDPGAALEVWKDIKRRRLRVVAPMLDSLFRALAAQKSPGGLEAGLSIMREARAEGMLTLAVRDAGLVALIKWLKEDRESFASIYASVEESEKSPDTMEHLSYANFLYSGVDGYSGTK